VIPVDGNSFTNAQIYAGGGFEIEIPKLDFSSNYFYIYVTSFNAGQVLDTTEPSLFYFD
jgi:hypothetical protein